MKMVGSEVLRVLGSHGNKSWAVRRPTVGDADESVLQVMQSLSGHAQRRVERISNSSPTSEADSFLADGEIVVRDDVVHGPHSLAGSQIRDGYVD